MWLPLLLQWPVRSATMKSAINVYGTAPLSVPFRGRKQLTFLKAAKALQESDKPSDLSEVVATTARTAQPPTFRVALSKSGLSSEEQDEHLAESFLCVAARNLETADKPSIISWDAAMKAIVEAEKR